ncbi:MAG: HpcH/HpaI aldolase/citrate lyase family protein [Thermaurantiacus sp.]
MTDFRPRRSVLYLPGSNARAIEKARTLAADVVIIDLEDAVAPDAKEAARAAAIAAVAAGGWGGREVAIRVNGLDTHWAASDFAAVAASAADVLVVPKIAGAADAARAVALAGDKPVWPLIETPRAVLGVEAIADTPGIRGLVAGFADLAKDLRLKTGPGREPLLQAMSAIVTAARAANIFAFDGVFTDITDATGLAAEAAQARAFGFDGKTCIHPSQLDAVNAAFSPTPDEVEHARGLIAAHEEAGRIGKAVATFRGKLIEVLHVAEAKRTLAVAEFLADAAEVAETLID